LRDHAVDPGGLDGASLLKARRGRQQDAARRLQRRDCFRAGRPKWKLTTAGAASISRACMASSSAKL
jgi:hypothetical protein